jgi:hypothetical protein
MGLELSLSHEGRSSLTVFEKKALKIFGSESDEIRVERRRIRNEKLHDTHWL